MPSSQQSRAVNGRVPLAEEISAIGPLKNRTKKRKSTTEYEGDSHVDPRSSRKILRIAQDLVDEEQHTANDGASLPNTAFEIDSRVLDVENKDLEEDEAPEAWGDEDHEDIEEVVSIHSVLYSGTNSWERTSTQKI